MGTKDILAANGHSLGLKGNSDTLTRWVSVFQGHVYTPEWHQGTTVRHPTGVDQAIHSAVVAVGKKPQINERTLQKCGPRMRWQPAKRKVSQQVLWAPLTPSVTSHWERGKSGGKIRRRVLKNGWQRSCSSLLIYSKAGVSSWTPSFPVPSALDVILQTLPEGTGPILCVPASPVLSATAGP